MLGEANCLGEMFMLKEPASKTATRSRSLVGAADEFAVKGHKQVSIAGAKVCIGLNGSGDADESPIDNWGAGGVAKQAAEMPASEIEHIFESKSRVLAGG